MDERILVVEDELNMAFALRRGLEHESYSVTLAHTGCSGLELATTGGFDGIILDVLLPLLDGFSVARELRTGGDATPILMLTALDTTMDIVTGLDAGAEDYLIKPFSFLELLARLRSLLRRGKCPARCLRVSDLAIDTISHAVSRGRRPVSLTKTEYLLLELLMRKAGQVVSREEIINEVWGPHTAIEQNSVDVHIRGLRAKITPCQLEELIHTVRGFGYKLAMD